jgi:hypothetical protein
MVSLRFFLVFLAAAFDQAIHVAAFLFFFNKEGIVFFAVVITGLFAEIHVLDARGFIIILAVLFNLLEADEFDIAGFGVIRLFLFTRLGHGNGRSTREIALGRQDSLGDEGGAALRAGDRLLQEIIESSGTGRACALGAKFGVDHVSVLFRNIQ